jgi:hypothetical protein
VGGDDDHRGRVCDTDPAFVLALVQPGTLIRVERPSAVAGNNEGKHALEWHEDELVVAVGVSGVLAGVGVHLGDDAKATGASSAGYGSDRVLGEMDTARARDSRRCSCGEDQGRGV